MKKVLKLMVLAVTVIGTVGLGMTACNTGGGTTTADGTVTVNLSNAATANDHYLFAFVYAEGETDVNNPATLLATNNVQIAGGTASVVLKVDNGDWMPTGTDWTGTGGVTYDIYIYTDSDDDNDPATGPGTAKQTVTFPQVLTIDGNQSIATDYTTMVDYIIE